MIMFVYKGIVLWELSLIKMVAQIALYYVMFVRMRMYALVADLGYIYITTNVLYNVRMEHFMMKHLILVLIVIKLVTM